MVLVVKNWPAKVGDTDVGSIPGLGRSGIGNGNLLQYSCLEDSMDRGPWQATVHGATKSQTWLSDWAHMNIWCFWVQFTLFSVLSIALTFISKEIWSVSLDFNGNPLQYSCLENPMDGGPGRLQSTGSQRDGHDWTTSLCVPNYRLGFILWTPCEEATLSLPTDWAWPSQSSSLGWRFWGQRAATPDWSRGSVQTQGPPTCFIQGRNWEPHPPRGAGQQQGTGWSLPSSWQTEVRGSQIWGGAPTLQSNAPLLGEKVATGVLSLPVRI